MKTKVTKKQVSLSDRLRFLLRSGKECVIVFKKVNGDTTIRRVKAIQPEDYTSKGVKIPSPLVVCFFDLKEQSVRCCRCDLLLSVQTATQYTRAIEAKRRWSLIKEIAEFYGISYGKAFKVSLATYQEDVASSLSDDRYEESTPVFYRKNIFNA